MTSPRSIVPPPPEPVSGAPHVLRQLNARHVLQTVRQAGPLSRADIAKATGLSKPTTRAVIEALVRAGYLRQQTEDDAQRAARPGRPAQLVSFRADLGYVLGIDVGGDKVIALLADLDGEVLATKRLATADLRAAAMVLDRVRAAIAAVLAEASVDRTAVMAMVVGTPGVVDPVSGSISLAPQLPGWEGIRLHEELADVVACPILIQNELHLSALGEQWCGAAQGVDDVVYVQIGMGIGLGMIIGGHLYRGGTGAAGEIGYLPIDASDAEPPDGIGRFEYAAGGSAYARLGQRAAREPGGATLRELAGGNPDAVDAAVVFAAARSGDPAAVAIVDTLVERLARGVAAVVLVLNPTTVIVGGGVSRAGATLLDRLDRYLRDLVPVVPRLTLSHLGDEAGAHGAIRLALAAVDERMHLSLPRGA